MMQRRVFLKTCSALAAALVLRPGGVLAYTGKPHSRRIPKSGERLPAIGMGSWLTFAVGDDAAARAQRVAVVRAFFAAGGRLIDSSPMYGTAEEVIGYCLEQLHARSRVFSASKVWTVGWQAGVRQMRRSQHLWGIQGFDLMQVHNLLDWRTQLATLKEWKQQGLIRYIGVTTSHGRRHRELAGLMEKEDAIDFVQFTYNLIDREAEQRLLPLAAERQLAVIINRPFRGGELFEYVARRALPGWARQIDCDNWAQLFLKYIISHPAVTCAIPATSRVDHMHENMGSLYGRLPDSELRKKIQSYFRSML
ncbi:MAG: aldo/keto reductase [Gammaproteobacteria bacterium]